MRRGAVLAAGGVLALVAAGPALGAVANTIDDVPVSGAQAGLLHATSKEEGTSRLFLGPDRTSGKVVSKQVRDPASPDPVELTTTITRNGVYVACLDVVPTPASEPAEDPEAEPACGQGEASASGVLVRKTLDVRIPAAAPRGLAVRVTERTVVLTWERGGDEPDLAGFQLVDNRTAPRIYTQAQACSDSGACTVRVRYPGTDASRHTYRLSALRACPQCENATPLMTAAARTEPVALAAVRPSASPSASPSRKGTGTRLVPGGADGLIVPGLPAPVPAVPAPGPTAAPLPDGTFRPELGYPTLTSPSPVADTVLTESQPSAPSQPGALSAVLASLADRDRLAPSLAAALVLLLASLHLRRWSRGGA